MAKFTPGKKEAIKFRTLTQRAENRRWFPPPQTRIKLAAFFNCNETPAAIREAILRDPDKAKLWDSGYRPKNFTQHQRELFEAGAKERASYKKFEELYNSNACLGWSIVRLGEEVHVDDLTAMMWALRIMREGNGIDRTIARRKLICDHIETLTFTCITKSQSTSANVREQAQDDLKIMRELQIILKDLWKLDTTIDQSQNKLRDVEIARKKAEEQIKPIIHLSTSNEEFENLEPKGQ